MCSSDDSRTAIRSIRAPRFVHRSTLLRNVKCNMSNLRARSQKRSFPPLKFGKSTVTFLKNKKGTNPHRVQRTFAYVYANILFILHARNAEAHAHAEASQKSWHFGKWARTHAHDRVGMRTAGRKRKRGCAGEGEPRGRALSPPLAFCVSRYFLRWPQFEKITKDRFRVNKIWFDYVRVHFRFRLCYTKCEREFLIIFWRRTKASKDVIDNATFDKKRNRIRTVQLQ